jgi:hypothetical protein
MMKLRAESAVFILENCSAQEEYDLVHSRAQKARRETPPKHAGDDLLVDEHVQRPMVDLMGANLVYSEENERVFNLYLCLVSIPVFYHFLTNLGEKCSEIGDLQITSSMHKFLQNMAAGRECVVDELLPEATMTMYGDLYSDLLATLQSELCERYFFEEDVWTTQSKDAVEKSKPAYQEYSPIVEMFHGKVRNGLYQLKGPSFEKIVLAFGGRMTVKRALEQLKKEERCFVTKQPQILTLVVDNSKIEVEGNNDVYFEKTLFSLCAFVTETESASYCYAKHGSTWYEYSGAEVKRCTVVDSMGYPSIMFYAKTR